MNILELDVTEMGYLAGIIDGEGCISLHGRRQSGRGYMTPSIQVSNTDKRLIDWLQELLGGLVYPVKDKDPIHAEHRKPVWLWCIFGAKARDILTELEPYLKLKGQQARLVLKVRPNKPGQRLTDEQRIEREVLLLQVRTLNQRGR